MKKLIIITILFIASVGFSSAQNFPFVVKPTYSLSIEKDSKVFTFPNDTLWIMKHSQYKVALSKAKELELAEQQLVKKDEIISTLKVQGAEKDSLANIYKKDRDFYSGYWDTCKADVKKMNKKGKRQRLYTKIAIIGGVVGTVLGVVVGVVYL